jgi:hypothetical protein
MGLFTKLEHAAASKLKEVFLDIKKLSEDADLNVEMLEKALVEAKQQAADLAVKAHQAAEEAATKAKMEAEALLLEAQTAAIKAADRTSKVVDKIDPRMGPDNTTANLTFTVNPANTVVG